MRRHWHALPINTIICFVGAEMHPPVLQQQEHRLHHVSTLNDDRVNCEGDRCVGRCSAPAFSSGRGHHVLAPGGCGTFER
jgi:hypothetical protein